MQATIHISTRCECPDNVLVPNSMRSWYSEEEWEVASHGAHECQGTLELRPYLRKDKTIWLCSCCNLSSDVAIEEGDGE